MGKKDFRLYPLIVLIVLFNLLLLYYIIFLFDETRLLGKSTVGIIEFEILEVVELNVTQSECDLGSGKVMNGSSYAILSCNGTIINWNITNGTSFNPKDLLIKNTGNRNITINVSSNKDAGTFIGGNASIRSFKISSRDTFSGSCGSGLKEYPGEEVTLQKNITLCDSLSYLFGRNSINVTSYLVIPDNAPPGLREVNLTFLGYGS
ncbi:MAG: hypothetical protein QXU40_00935 [Candidatus Pacearchaeota archaeon]